MKIAISITNHNQNEAVKDTLKRINKLERRPDHIFVCSDDTPFISIYPGVTSINNTKMKGRCQNRNSVIEYFMKSDCDAIIFIDGDSYPKEKDFIKEYEKLLKKYDLVFGTREHSNIKGLGNPPSDLLTANMDNLWAKQKIDYTDLRVVSGAVKAWQKSREADLWRMGN